MSKRTPSPDDIRFAAEWLRAYDDSHDGGEQSAIAAEVARGLEDRADAAEECIEARNMGVPVARLRRALAWVLTEFIFVAIYSQENKFH